MKQNNPNLSKVNYNKNQSIRIIKNTKSNNNSVKTYKYLRKKYRTQTNYIKLLPKRNISLTKIIIRLILLLLNSTNSKSKTNNR